MSSIFNLNVHSFYKDQFFILKFLFIEVIDSIYLIFVQNIQALSRMYFQHTNDITHFQKTCQCWVKWRKGIGLKGKMS